MRDRSWGGVRPEAHTGAPPVSWLTCVFGEDCVVSCTAFDTPDTGPEWAGMMEVPGGRSLVSGWVWRDGTFTQITELVAKRTERDPQTLVPTAVEVSFIDGQARRYDLRADVIAGGNWRTWMNFDAAYCLARWSWGDRVSHGDVQEFQGIDYIRRFMPTGAAGGDAA
ncbi:MAG: DUF7064 domain-containing protein [Solirubrobacteraceae bacterium]